MSDAHPSDWREIATERARANRSRVRFPSWSNRVAPIGGAVVIGLLGVAAAAYGYYGDERNLSVGYRPDQPIEFSHKQHVGDLGIDCRYCHSAAEQSAFAAVPSAQTCFTCHAKILPKSAKLLRLWEAVAKGKAIQWTRVHKIPEHAHFDHSAHLSAGVGCSTCHGRVDQMSVIEQKEPLSMGWCLDCHRNPAPHIRSPRDITRMTGETPAVPAARRLDPPLHCSGCHQ